MLGVHALPGRIEESYVRRLEALPEDVRLLLLVAAAEPIGDPLLLLSASERLGIEVSAVETATDGLLALGERVTFRHPLVRSAAYRSAGAPERRAAHLALAEATDRDADPDRRAWHLAAAAAGPDEDVALELERSAGRAQARGGLAAAAAFLQRAVALTGDPTRRADRALAAAEASLGRARSTSRAGCWRRRRSGRWTSSSAPVWTCCAPRPRTPRAAGATLRRCSFELRRRSSRSIRSSRARPISTRGARRCSPGELASTAGMHEVSREAQGGPAPRRASASVRSAAGRVLAGVHGRPLRGGAGARAGRDRLRGQRRLDRGGPPLGLARDRGRRDGVGLRDLPRGCDARGRARPRGRGTGGARGQRQRDGAGCGARWRVRKGGIAGCRGRQRHRRHGRPGRALRRPRARRPSGPRGGGFRADRRHHRGVHGRRAGNRGPIRTLGTLGAPQRSRPLRGGDGRRAGGERRHAGAVRLRLGGGRAARSRDQERRGRSWRARLTSASPRPPPSRPPTGPSASGPVRVRC